MAQFPDLGGNNKVGVSLNDNPVINNPRLVVLTQAAYNALPTKDASILYLIRA